MCSCFAFVCVCTCVCICMCFALCLHLHVHRLLIVLHLCRLVRSIASSWVCAAGLLAACCMLHAASPSAASADAIYPRSPQAAQRCACYDAAQLVVIVVHDFALDYVCNRFDVTRLLCLYVRCNARAAVCHQCAEFTPAASTCCTEPLLGATICAPKWKMHNLGLTRYCTDVLCGHLLAVCGGNLTCVAIACCIVHKRALRLWRRENRSFILVPSNYCLQHSSL